VPGNHDLYDALEAFTANFLEPEAARAAIRARVAADYGLTTTTEQHITAMIDEAARLRQEYRVQAGRQRAPYFEVQTDRFALLVVDTGILRTVDDDQLQWLGAALKRADGKFKMAILGHPLYAAGHYQADDEADFAALHNLLREHEVAVVMAGDTHDFEYYREPYESGGQARSMIHFVNGGGGAYLSIGTALAWPERPAVADCAFYPRTDALVARIDRTTPGWKQPLWFWTKRLGGWPSSPEGLAAAFDSNRAPFFQSFMEVRVSGTENVVRLLLHGVHGPLRWQDLQLHGQVVPAGKTDDDPVEFTVAMPPGTDR
jgi:3',5'-cyclic AMP phosphodiesterase CpdA